MYDECTDGIPGKPGDAELWVANEFASCRVTHTRFGNGHRIRIHSDRRDTTVVLDATALDALTRLTTDQISQLVTSVTERDSTESQRSTP